LFQRREIVLRTFDIIAGIINFLLTILLFVHLSLFLYETKLRNYKTGIVLKSTMTRSYANPLDFSKPVITFEKDEVLLLLKVEKSKNPHFKFEMKLFTFLSLKDGKIKECDIKVTPGPDSNYRKQFKKL
jgi:hypothetical protein